MEPNKYIDPVKTGKFIAKLRKSHNWTQDELGSKIFITRKAVSKWETGKCCPSIDMLKNLSEIFGVSFDDLIAGEFVDDNGHAISGIRKVLVNKKVKRISLISLIGIFILLLIFFIHNYNSTRVYNINYEDENFTIRNGVIILSHAKNHINIGNFYSDRKDIDNDTVFDFLMYYKDNDEKIEILSFTSKWSNYNDKDTNNEMIAKMIEDNIDNLYLNIKFKNIKNKEYEFDIKLDVELDFKNNFFYSIKNNIIKDLFDNNDKPKLEVNVNTDIMPVSSEVPKENINLDFLYKMTPKELKKKYNNKTIKSNGEIYKISYDDGTGALTITSKKVKSIIHITVNNVKIKYFSDRYTLCTIDDNHDITPGGECNNYSNILKEIIELLK